MAVQLSTAVRNARLDAIEAAIGPAARIAVRTGEQPESCDEPDSGELLVSYVLGQKWATKAKDGAKSLNSLPIRGTAEASGEAGHFRIYASRGSACGYQGSVTVTGGDGDMTVDSASISLGQMVDITGFTITDGNA